MELAAYQIILRNTFVALSAFFLAAGTILQNALPASILDIHGELSKHLSPEQTNALSSIYPDFRLLTRCSGCFSGANREELVLGVWTAMESDLQRNTPVCFATSDTCNNWDCLLYRPKDGRFRLWYQQARAD